MWACWYVGVKEIGECVCACFESVRSLDGASLIWQSEFGPIPFRQPISYIHYQGRARRGVNGASNYTAICPSQTPKKHSTFIGQQRRSDPTPPSPVTAFCRSFHFEYRRVRVPISSTCAGQLNRRLNRRLHEGWVPQSVASDTQLKRTRWTKKLATKLAKNGKSAIIVLQN